MSLRVATGLRRALAKNQSLGRGNLNAYRLSFFSGTAQQMAKKLEGKVAVVTASTEGIGFAIAKSLGQNGAKVYISSRKEDKVLGALKELGSEINVSGMVCHAGKAEDRRNLIDKVVKECGSIDILVSNAAVNPVFGPMLETDEASWDKIFDMNVKSAFFLVKECVPHMTKKGGSIIFVSSVAGFQPMPLLGAYSLSKTTLLAMTKALSVELAPMNIRVNGIAPGVIKTNFSMAIWKNEQVKKYLLKQIPLKRIGEPDEIGPIATFLSSDDAKYITGEIIAATGGMQCRI